jgi:hypothetical protein
MTLADRRRKRRRARRKLGRWRGSQHRFLALAGLEEPRRQDGRHLAALQLRPRTHAITRWQRRGRGSAASSTRGMMVVRGPIERPAIPGDPSSARDPR